MFKQKNLMKKLSTLLLSTTMIITTISQLGTSVYANELPDSTQFATKEELKTFNTNDNDGEVKSAKVYFGNDRQQWWIAGNQGGDNLDLFAASPLQTEPQAIGSQVKGQPFEPNENENKTDTSLWADCTYSSGTVISEVYPNHYGASPLRNTLKGLETSYFTSEEQNQMKDTTIYTNDDKYMDDGHSLEESVYSTTNKLYLAYGDYGEDNNYVTIGINQINNLNSGLRIDKNYWGGSAFWLRAPSKSYSNYALVASPGHISYSGNVDNKNALVPAFKLNTSSVLFGSKVSAITREGEATTNGAFTLRYQEINLGSAQVSYDKSKVTLDNVPNDVYLVVQNSNGAYAKKTNNNTPILASDMNLDSFENCKVWIEATDTTNRMTYATLATQQQKYSINITNNTGLNITSHNGIQEVLSNISIQDIHIEIEHGYYLPDDYISNIKGLNGLTITKTEKGFKISGIPTNDVNITLPQVTAMSKAPTPTLTVDDIVRTKNSLTVNGTFDTATYGDIEYQWDNGDWSTNKTLSNLQVDSTHKVSVRYKGKGIYLPSNVASVNVSTKKDGNDVIIVPNDLKGICEQTLKNIQLTTHWSWVDENISLLVGKNVYKAHFDTTSYETDYDFNGVNGYNAQEHYVERELSVDVSKASSITEQKPTVNDSNKKEPQTNDQTNIELYMSLFVLSSLLVISCILFKKKKI